MTALNRGVCVLPEWLIDSKINALKLKKISIGKQGLRQKLFLAIRETDRSVPYILKFKSVGQQAADRLNGHPHAM